MRSFFCLPAVKATRVRCPIFYTTESARERHRSTENMIVRLFLITLASSPKHAHTSNAMYISPSPREERPCSVRGQCLVSRDAFWVFGE